MLSERMEQPAAVGDLRRLPLHGRDAEERVLVVDVGQLARLAVGGGVLAVVGLQFALAPARRPGLVRVRAVHDPSRRERQAEREVRDPHVAPLAYGVDAEVLRGGEEGRERDGFRPEHGGAASAGGGLE